VEAGCRDRWGKDFDPISVYQSHQARCHLGSKQWRWFRGSMWVDVEYATLRWFGCQVDRSSGVWGFLTPMDDIDHHS